MGGSKYVDSEATVQLIGCILKQPSLLDDEGKFFFSEEDFVSEFHKIVFGSIYNLYQLGAKNINVKTIDDYLSNRPESYAIYKAGRGPEWVRSVEESADLSNFEYYYNRVKKMTLLREYNRIGLDVSWIYDPDILDDIDKKQKQNNYVDNLSLNEIADLIDAKVMSIRASYVDNNSDESMSASQGIDDLFLSLQEIPDVGQPMYGKYVNTITRGMRLGKLYLRSAASGVGKTRTMVADFCNCGCAKIWEDGEWVDNGESLPCVFISTELELDELQTMMVAFLADINEENILNNVLSFNERTRIKEAIEIIKNSPLYVEVIPDFSLKDIENIIKRNIRTHQCRYIFYDYVHTSMKILEEITRRSGGIRLREDNILFLLSVKLKEICTQFNVFILTSTQLNGEKK